MKNESAFPTCDPGYPENQNWETGITKREYFAAKAMQGLISYYGNPTEHGYVELVKRSYLIADEMIKEQSK